MWPIGVLEIFDPATSDERFRPSTTVSIFDLMQSAPRLVNRGLGNASVMHSDSNEFIAPQMSASITIPYPGAGRRSPPAAPSHLSQSILPFHPGEGRMLVASSGAFRSGQALVN